MEYLSEDYKLQTTSDKYTLCEIPEGADILIDIGFGKNRNCFYSEGFKRCFNDGLWVDTVCSDENLSYWESCNVIWQRDKVEVEDSVNMSKVDETLKERQSQYGCFEDVAFVTQGIVELMNKCNYKNMPHPHQMALYMIASKMARLVNGDFNHKDSWHDIGGYSKLIENLIGE